jgi:thiol:disulfide interchange protein DsbC
MINGKTPAEANCDTPVETVLALGRKLMVRGTPNIIFSDGSRANGALPLDALKQRLDKL